MSRLLRLRSRRQPSRMPWREPPLPPKKRPWRCLYKEATGRFPQDSSDRRAVYLGGFVLVGIVFLGIITVAIILGVNDKTVPEPFWTVATALGSGVIGGLFEQG